MEIVFLSCLTFTSLVILSLSMSKNYRQIRKKPLDKNHAKPMRQAGWLLMSSTIIFAIYQLEFGLGLAIFFNALAVVAFLHIWLLSYAPKYLIPLSIILPLASGIAWGY